MNSMISGLIDMALKLKTSVLGTQKSEMKIFTLDEMREEILKMEVGVPRSFMVDHIPIDDEFDLLVIWLATNIGAVHIGRDFHAVRIDVTIYNMQ